MTEHFTELTANEGFWGSVDLECPSRIFCLLFQNKPCFVPSLLTLLSRNHRYNVVHLNLRKHNWAEWSCTKIITFCPTVKHRSSLNLGLCTTRLHCVFWCTPWKGDSTCSVTNESMPYYKDEEKFVMEDDFYNYYRSIIFCR